MTILDMLSKKYINNELMQKALQVIKDNFISLINDNYELIISDKGELNVKIPSLEKRDEYVYKSIGDYQYPLVMCMRISDIKNVLKNAEVYEYILAKFMELYKDKLELLVKDVNSVNKLMNKITTTKSHIDYITYYSIGAVVLGLIYLCIATNMTQTVRTVLILGIILFSAISVVGQLIKENQVKKVIDSYLVIIKTEWYKRELTRQYAFLCNFIG